MHLYLSRVLKGVKGHLAPSLKVESTENNPYMCEHMYIVICQCDTCGGQMTSHEVVGLQTAFPPFLSTSFLAFKFTLYFFNLSVFILSKYLQNVTCLICISYQNMIPVQTLSASKDS